MRSNSRSNQQRCLERNQHHEELFKLLTGLSSGTVGVQMRKIVVGSVIGSLINSLVLLPVAWADAVKLGVVKSQENEGQWSGITTRLHSIGVAYCIVDFSKVQQTSDLGSTQLLFLPNIERLEPVQLAALQDWMGKGGRVIVSGPMGTLSQPEVRNQLRSLLGAYWGFALTKPSTLEPLRTNGQTWVRNAGLAATIQGGVVIPAGLNSLTAAAWSQSDNSPAVVTTEQSTFFGWRWGVDEVAPAAVDSAWLRAALGRYNLAPTTGRQKPKESEQYCVSSQTPTVNKPITPLPNRDEQNTPPVGTPTTPGGETQVDLHEEVAPVPIKPNNTGPLTAMQVAAMSQELENLIGRFESALLAANATNSNLNIQTSAAIEQFLGTSTNEKLKVEPSTLNGVAPTTATNSASRAIAQARMGLQNFRDAATRNDYRGARQYWSDARRTLWNNYPIDRKFAQPEIRAIWLDRGTIVRAKSEQDLAKVFDQLAAMGFNTVFFETVNASYPIYPSRVAPEQNPLVRGWDPLAAAVKLAHERGMELHAWVWLFAAANQRHNALLNQPANYPGPVLAAHPDWAIVNR
ncbi:MAG TPA: family 10 glycosylhydrolase, partial [Leptolyngbyaceae cyanobacterium]